MRPRYRIPFGGSLVVAVCLVASPAAWLQVTDPLPEKIGAWIAAAYAHKAGEIDAAGESITSWSYEDLRRVSLAATSRFTAIEEGRATNRLDFHPYIVMFRRYGLTDRASFNRALRLIAFLHADIAVLHKTREGYTLPPDDRRILEFEDGRQIAVRSGTFHWEFGRTVLGRQVPRPTDDAFTRLWYRTTSAILQQVNDFSELTPHLAMARALFPTDAPLLLFDATMHEAIAEPRVQNFLNGSLPGVRARMLAGSASHELGQAEDRLREALAADPSFSEARVRLGRILHLRGRHEEALTEFDRALGQPLPAVMKYYALLYAGRAQHTLGRFDAARQAFESAKTLYPAAQSPWLGLSEIARDEGDRDGAVKALRLLGVSPLSVDRDDPLWVYRQVHDPTYEALLAQLRQTATVLRLEANRAMPAQQATPPAVTGEPR